MWRKSDVKINFKHFKIYFLLPKSAATQRVGLVLLRRCRGSSELPDVVPRRNVWAWFCCVAAGDLPNCLTLCRDATSRPIFVASRTMWPNISKVALETCGNLYQFWLPPLEVLLVAACKRFYLGTSR